MNRMTYSKSLSALAVILVLSIFVKPDLSTAQPEEDSVLNESIYATSIRLNGLVPFGATQQTVVQHLGNANQIKSYSSELWGQVVEMHYGQSVVFIHDGKFADVDIKDGRLFLTMDQGILGVGDHLSQIAEMFPSSYSNMKFYPEANTRAIIVDIKIVLNGITVVIDDHLTIGVNSNDNVSYVYYSIPP